MEITGHKQGKKMKRQLHCNIPVPPLPEQKSKNYCCDECVGDYSKTDVCKSFRLRWLMSHGSNGENFTISVMDFSVELFFKSLKNHFVEKEDAVNELQLS